MTTKLPGWSEQDSAAFIADGEIFTPERALQLETFQRLLGAEARDVIELCSGAGTLAKAILEACPRAHVYAYEGSTAMLDHADRLLAPFTGRFTLRPFELAARDWRQALPQADAVISSLAVHHLPAAEKRQLFADMFATLRNGGRLVVADLIEPADEVARNYAAWAWDATVRAQADAASDAGAIERFRELDWNYYADPEPDPADQPSTLFEQLSWLRAAGFADVDVFWMKAGHAIFGGRKP